ncbi:hypothetical protein QYE76_052499 [Lolium multiflorum]|uniref:Uncharacterized protein n=1 Tax=Lolium multiflorum TaxID=4521 RepID=A0AAD8SUU9_LOLMU|nr:hypothetical protein QYE76_052499 [Lolium multiflorum]
MDFSQICIEVLCHSHHREEKSSFSIHPYQRVVPQPLHHRQVQEIKHKHLFLSRFKPQPLHHRLKQACICPLKVTQATSVAWVGHLASSDHTAMINAYFSTLHKHLQHKILIQHIYIMCTLI